MDTLKLIEKTGSCKILISLLDYGKMCFSDLLNKIDCNERTLMKRIDELSEAGLIDQQKSDRFPFTRQIFLTGEGVDVAREIRYVYDVPKLSWTEKILLILIHMVGNIVKGKTRLEKLPFLLWKEYGVPINSFYRYKPESHGPFSVDVLKDIDGLIKMGLIEYREEIIPLDDGREATRSSYILSEEGKETVSKISSELPEYIKKNMFQLKKYNKMPLKKLLDYVHEEYPEFKSKIDAKH